MSKQYTNIIGTQAGWREGFTCLSPGVTRTTCRMHDKSAALPCPIRLGALHSIAIDRRIHQAATGFSAARKFAYVINQFPSSSRPCFTGNVIHGHESLVVLTAYQLRVGT